VPGISLEDLQRVYQVLYFGKGADMPAANAVRNLIAMLNTKHGRYVREATLIELLTQEVPPDLRVHLYEPGKSADAYDAAIGVLHDFGCWDDMPSSVRDFLNRRDPQYGRITPQEVAGRPHHMFRVMGPEYMIEAARKRAEELGINTTVLVSSLSDVEAQPVADTMAYIASEAEALDRPLKPPCVFIFGGELLVTVGNATGNGGRNQEFALATAARISGSKRIVVASADSDGTDGPTTYAGGIADGETYARAREAGFNVAAELANHNSSAVLTRLGDALHTGVRSTDVRDLRVVYVGG
jgi:glycerate-2-kinase